MPGNDVRYKIARWFMMLCIVSTSFIMILRLISQYVAERLSFLCSIFVWLFADIGMKNFEQNQRPLTLLKAIGYCLVFIVAYVIPWYFSRRRIEVMIGSFVVFIPEFIFFAMMNQDNPYILIFGIIVRTIVILSLVIGIIYGYRAIYSELDDDIDVTSAKFINESYSNELALIKRTLTIKRKKQLLASHICFRCFLDGIVVASLEPDEEITVEIDGNSHLFEVFAVYGAYNDVYSVIEISEGENDVNTNLSAKALTIFSKTHIIISE